MSKSFIINGVKISNDNPPYIIAELSANHNGSIDRAKKTILEAKKSNVSAVKIQTYSPDTMTIRSQKSDFLIKKGLWKGRTLYDLYSEAYMPYEWHKELFEYAKKIGVTIFSSPFDESAVDLLESLDTPAYKISSFELIDLPLIEYIAKKKKPIIISTGMAELSEINDAIETAKINGCDEIAIMHCISAYPAKLNNVNLKFIKKLKKEFKVHVGFSDHTLGTTACLSAVALGAALIEKHFTLARQDGGVDSAFSAEPNEMKKLVKDCKDIHISLGSEIFKRSEDEKSNVVFRRSLYFVENLNKGQIIKKNHIRRIRPGFGLSPKYYERVLGSKLKRNVEKGDRVSLENTNLNKND